MHMFSPPEGRLHRQRPPEGCWFVDSGRSPPQGQVEHLRRSFIKEKGSKKNSAQETNRKIKNIHKKKNK